MGQCNQPATRQRTGEPELADGLITQECWYSKTTEHSRQEAHGTEFWEQTKYRHRDRDSESRLEATVVQFCE